MIKIRAIPSLAVLAALALFSYALVPSPKPAKAQFTAQALFITDLALGTANAQTLIIPNIGSYSDLRGVPVTFVPRFGANTGPTTLNVNGLGPQPVLRNTPGSPSLLGGGELTSDAQVTVMFLGAKFIIVSAHDITSVGATIEFRGSVAPTGYLTEDGSCVSQSNYAPLFTVIGTAYGSCGAGLFALPDSRGTVFAAADNQGANGSAGRITSGGSGCTATSVPFSCGAQNKTITTSFLPASGLSVPALTVPSLTTSGQSVPALTIPSLTASTQSVPGLSVPALSVPALSIPSLSVSTNTANVGNIPLSSGSISSLQTQGNPTTNITPANSSGTWSGTTSLAASGSTGTGSTGTGSTGTGTTGTGTTGGGTTTASATGTGTTGAMGSGTAMPVLNPILGGVRAIKF